MLNAIRAVITITVRVDKELTISCPYVCMIRYVVYQSTAEYLRCLAV